MKSVWIKDQRKSFTKEFSENHLRHIITAKLRYDDNCDNGHNTFSITGDIDYIENGRRKEFKGGCIHEDIAKHFPELVKYLKWHLCSSDGPMHYLANTIYSAGDRDCYGKKKGEPSSYKDAVAFKGFPIRFRHFDSAFTEFIEKKAGPDGEWFLESYRINPRVTPVEHPKDDRPYKFGPKYTFDEYPCDWYAAPFDSIDEANEFLNALQSYPVRIERVPDGYSEGKERDFAAARHSAIWPEATDEQLSLPPEELKKLLEARLPSLLEEFAAAMTELGFAY